MKFFSTFALACILPVATAELEFLPIPTPDLEFSDDGNSHRNLWGQGGIIGCWGQFHQLGFCVEKVPDPLDATADNVKFLPCDNREPKQMWRFQNPGTEENWYRTGLVYNMDGGCLAIRGPPQSGKWLKVMACNESNNKQLWWGDGDSVTTLESQGKDFTKWLCVQAATFPIKTRDPVVLTSLCSTSLDQ